MNASATVHHAVAAAAVEAGPGVWGVACSGGVDSLVLAHAAAAVLGAARVVVMHVDHGLQPAAREVAGNVAQWCREVDLACVVRQVVVPAGASLEAQARHARYTALHQVAHERGLGFVVTAHNAGDQAETLLMRLIRGTGPTGLVAMQLQRGALLRPLLALPRSMLAQYAREHDLPVWHDPMNDDERFFRVRVRKILLPWLAAENPQIETALGQLAQQLGEWHTVVAAACELAALPWSQAQARHAAPAARALAWARVLTDAAIPVTAAAQRGLRAALAASAHGTTHFDIPGGAIEVRYGQLFLVAASAVGAAQTQLHVRCDQPWMLRTRQPGDTMQPARLAGKHRKLSDLYIDAKIPRALRATARLVVQAENPTMILWAEYLGPAWGSAIAVELKT